VRLSNLKYELQKGAHSVYSLYFHLICVTKYRKKVFDERIAIHLKQLVITISTPYDVTIIEQEVDFDHIHILFSCTPKPSLPQYIRVLKSSTAKSLRKKDPQIYKQLWGKAFWSPSYFLATTGQVTLENSRKYVENQGKS
jgi:putative transposase